MASNAEYTASLKEDVVELEALIAECTRPKVRALLCDYLQQLRAEIEERSGSAAAGGVASTATTPAPPASLPTPPASASTKTSTATPASAPAPPAPVKLNAPPPPASRSDYITIASFGWDQDEYNKEPSNVYVHILSGFDGIGACKECVSCDFTKESFDLKVHDFNGKNYRLKKTNLDKEIDPDSSKVVVKKNSIKIALRKIKGKFGYDQWIDLVAKRPKTDAADKDPGAGLMDMMKQMYEDGDDQMKKTLGEAMLKSRQEQANPSLKGKDRLDMGTDYGDDF